MRQAVERWFSGAHARLRRLSGVPSTHGVLPVQRITPFPRSASDRQVSLDNRARRLELYEAVRRRHRAGEALLAIARTMQLARGTVRKYAQAADFPERSSTEPQHHWSASRVSARAACRRLRGCRRAVARDPRARVHWHGQTGTTLAQRASDQTGQDSTAPLARPDAG